MFRGRKPADFATEKYGKSLFNYTQEEGSIKKAKEARYLTVQSLLDHPYFMAINEADISIVIDEFEKLQQQELE